MELERGKDNVWRQPREVTHISLSPEDQMIAAEEAKGREDRITRAVDEIKDDESEEKTLEGKGE